MKAWYLCECPYPFVPQEVLDSADSVRASLPNHYVDPRRAADLYHEVLDEFLLCDELGINVISNEHHAGINCLFGASPLFLGALARQTRKVRILSLGTLISIRKDPVRVAEEYAAADVLSRGRLEIGFVKSGGSEMASGNANPVGFVERFWEAIDLIQATLTHHDGPISWEGKHYRHRSINIWPPCWQRPHPPFWAATGDPGSSAELARRDILNTVVLRGPEGTKRAWDAYKAARLEAGMAPAGPDRFAYSAFVYTGETDEEAVRIGSQLLWFVNTSLKQAPQYGKLLPGQSPPEAAPVLYRSKPPPGGAAGRPGAMLAGITPEQAIAQGLMFAGNPDTVVRQINEFQAKVGGFANLVLIGRSGFMDHAQAEKGLRLFARDVLPRLQTPTLASAA